MLALMRLKSLPIISLLQKVVASAAGLMLSIGVAAASPEGRLVHFPAVEGVNLDNAAQALPGAFKGQFNLVLMAFRREQQAEVDTWLPELRRMALERSGFDFYELPVIGPKVAPLRWIIRKGMGSKITEPGARLRTILVFAEKAPLLSPLNIVSEETIAVLLLDGQGRLLWRSEGFWSPAKGAALRRAVGSFAEFHREGRHE